MGKLKDIHWTLIHSVIMGIAVLGVIYLVSFLAEDNLIRELPFVFSVSISTMLIGAISYLAMTKEIRLLATPAHATALTIFAPLINPLIWSLPLKSSGLFFIFYLLIGTFTSAIIGWTFLLNTKRADSIKFDAVKLILLTIVQLSAICSVPIAYMFFWWIQGLILIALGIDLFGSITPMMQFSALLQVIGGVYGWLSLIVFYRRSPVSLKGVSAGIYVGLIAGTVTAITLGKQLVLTLPPIVLAASLIALAIKVSSDEEKENRRLSQAS